MDGVFLVNAEEVLCIAQDAYAYAVYGDTDAQLFMWEVLESQKIAQEYVERKQMKFDENEDIIDNPF